MLDNDLYLFKCFLFHLNRRAMLEEQVEMRLAIDKKALQIVERLLDNSITEDFLVDCVS